jgi:predicted glycogen debranching enzyme
MSTEPFIEFGREICGDLPAALRREWLVTNGLGGYASASVPGTPTRSYHGVLVAALEPPVERTVLVAAFDEWVVYQGERYPLCTHEFADSGIAPEGYRHLQSFALDGALPVWTFAIADALIERRVWMVSGENTSYVRYRVVRSSGPIDFEVIPLTTCRSFHELTSGEGQTVTVDATERRAVVRFGSADRAVALVSERGRFEANGCWWWGFRFREETARGLADRGDLYAPGTFRFQLAADESCALVASTDLAIEPNAEATLQAAQNRQSELIRTASAEKSSPLVQQLVLAADQFIVARALPDKPNGESIIAGYHWFNDWGRDTMISLPGLCLSTGRFDEAESILRSFAGFVDQGLLPNNFPDRAGVIPGYNTVDATLWYVLAIHAYVRATGNKRIVEELLPVLRDIVRHHIEGTRYRIGVDPADGLLSAGEPGVQLTWMDAKVGDWVVTPRIGKPVEINALWYNVLRFMQEFDSPPDATDYGQMAERVRDSFQKRYRSPEYAYLADLIDGPDGDDWSIRPNQIFALSLPYPLLGVDDARQILDVVGGHLLTSYGLRSLAPHDPRYAGNYGGDQVQRDGAYHQGTVWSWLLGPFAEASLRLDGDGAFARSVLLPMADHLRDAGLGSISEIFEGDAPHLPRGCVAQAWSVGETLRVLQILDASDARTATPTWRGKGPPWPGN